MTDSPNAAATARKNAEIVLLTWIDRLPHALEISSDLLITSPERVAAFQQALEVVIAGDLTEAAEAADRAGYQVVIFSFGDTQYVALADQQTKGVGPTVIINMAARRDIVASAPHPIYEEGVDVEAGLFITRLEARGAVIAGAHRCASSIASQCSGTTSVCTSGESSAYRLSDAGHNTDLLYQQAHEFLAQAWPGSVFFSLHGMDRMNDTDVIISDGTVNVGDMDALPNRIRDKVRFGWGNSGGYVVSCQGADDGAVAYQNLCGTTNVQGRFLNQSPDACDSVATRSSGRFVHIAQTDAILGNQRTASSLNISGTSAEALLQGIAATIPSFKELEAGREKQ